MKNYADSDYLYAADLNEISGSSNMRFASTAVRDVTLVGSMATIPGMVSQMQDDNITYKYVSVSGTSYWTPAPNTLVCSVLQTTAHAIPANTNVTVVNMTTVASRNLGGWWGLDKFTPRVPGYYDLTAAVSFTWYQISDGSRYSSIWFNGAILPGSGAALPISNNAIVVLPTRTVPCYFNGTTDFCDVRCYSTSGSTINTSVVAGNASGFTAKYLGP